MPTFGQLEHIWRRRAFDDIGVDYASLTGDEPNWTFNDFAVALAEGEEQWCRRTLGLNDYTSSFLQIPTVVGQSQYPLDQRILEIKRAKPVSSPLLLLTSQDEIDLYAPTWEADPNGIPVFFLTDVQKNVMWLYPSPASVDTIKLSVSRLPLTSPTSPDAPLYQWSREDAPEILPTYHLSLLDWVTFRLYDFQARQTETPKAMWFEKSREAYQRFEDAYGVLPGSKVEADRAEGYPRERRYGEISDSTGGRP